MSKNLFDLRRLRDLDLSESQLQNSIQNLNGITSHLQKSSSIGETNLVDELRQKMHAGIELNQPFEEYTAVKRRSWLLLNLYLNDLGAPPAWLPPFDLTIGESVLGEGAQPIKKHLRRLATQLFFTHFGYNRIPCLDWLAERLQSSWRASQSESNADPAAMVWAHNCKILFSNDAPHQVAKQWKAPMTVHEMADAYHIHESGQFREALFEALILNRLRTVDLSKYDSVLSNLIISEKDRTLSNGNLLGSEATKILITRVQGEYQSVVPKEWNEEIVAFGCDPRMPNKTEQQKWWGWATTAQKDVAIRALSELTLKAFIDFLEDSLKGTSTYRQFPKRKQMLLDLFDLGKIIEARIVVHQDLYHSMDQRTKRLLRPSRVSGRTSFICLRCTDETFLIEGTHSFGLRGFVGKESFPINHFWGSPPKLHTSPELRVHEDYCNIYQRHHTGDWISDFVWQLKSYNILWKGLN